MASYKRFEETPVWNLAIDLAAAVFELTSHAAFKYRGDLVNQIRRAALSVSNNIAEGYERGTTSDLINFLYIARGSCGETRSMTRFAVRLGGMEQEREGIEKVTTLCENVSRQLFGWIDALKNSSIRGERHLTDKSRTDFALEKAQEEFREKFGPEAANQAEAEGRRIEFLRERYAAQIALNRLRRGSAAKVSGEKCPVCGEAMVKRHDRAGHPFWGCVKYPACKGTREWITPK